MQGNFAQWSWKVCCGMIAMGLMSAAVAEAGSKYSKYTSKTKAPVRTPAPKPYCPPPKPVCPPPKPVCEPVPVCVPKQPVCEWDVTRLRSKVQQIGKAVVCFQQKAARCKPDRSIIKAAINFVTALVKCGAIVSNCNADFEREIACVESSLCELEKAVECSRNNDLICLVKEIRCIVKELSSCKIGCSDQQNPA